MRLRRGPSVEFRGQNTEAAAERWCRMRNSAAKMHGITAQYKKQETNLHNAAQPRPASPMRRNTRPVAAAALRPSGTPTFRSATSLFPHPRCPRMTMRGLPHSIQAHRPGDTGSAARGLCDPPDLDTAPPATSTPAGGRALQKRSARAAVFLTSAGRPCTLRTSRSCGGGAKRRLPTAQELRQRWVRNARPSPLLRTRGRVSTFPAERRRARPN